MLEQSAALPVFPQTTERRAFIRYPRTLDTLWEALGLRAADLTSATTVDLSTTGVCLILDRPITPNSTLILRLPSAISGYTSHLVRVKRCIQSSSTEYQIGCSFVKPLSSVQLKMLLND